MYSDIFCQVYNTFGWNYYPEIFAEQLFLWLGEQELRPQTGLDLACGTGILCRMLREQGIAPRGMDLSQGMIHIARAENPEIPFDVGDMITYAPGEQFDLITCTGDAVNHIPNIQDVEKIFANVYGMLHDGGVFVFDILNENEVSDSQPFESQMEDGRQIWFQMTRPEKNQVVLSIRVFAPDGTFTFEEQIHETIHDPEEICQILRRVGFADVKRSDHLPESTQTHGTTWFVTARKPGK